MARRSHPTARAHHPAAHKTSHKTAHPTGRAHHPAAKKAKVFRGKRARLNLT